MIVFVCSPYRGDVRENTALAKRVCRMAALEGHTVLCPHLFYPQFLRDENDREREIGIASGLKMLEMAEEVGVGDGQISTGISREIARAGELAKNRPCRS